MSSVTRTRSRCAKLGAVSFVLGAAMLPLAAHAVDTSWDAPPATPGDWNTPANWNTDMVPGPADNAFINNGGTATITGPIPEVIDMRAGEGAGNAGTIQHSAGTARVNEWLRLGVNGGTGTYSLSGTGDLTVRHALNVGEGGTGTLNVSGGTLTKLTPVSPGTGDQWFNIGYNEGGNGTFNLSGGTVQVNGPVLNPDPPGGSSRNVFLVGRNGGSGVVNQTGGLLNVDGETNIGDASGTAGPTGVYNISAGTLQADDLNVGAWNNANGTLNVSGTGQVVAENVMQVGRSGDGAVSTGLVSQTGGTVTPRALRLGVQGGAGGSSGTYTMSAGTLRQPDQANLDDQGGWNHIGQAAASAANGPRSGTFNLSGTGMASFDTRTHVGSAVGSSGTVNQTGGTFEVRRHELIIGDTGTGVYNISAGNLRTLSTAHDIVVGHWDNANGTMAVSGTAVVETARDFVVGNGNADNAAPTVGLVNQTGGTVRVANNLVLARQADATGTYNLAGGTLDLTGGNIERGAGTATFAMTGGRLQNAGGTNFPLNQQGGTLAPGESAAVLGSTTITGDYNLGPAGTLEIHVGGAGATDQLNVNGGVTLAGNLDIVSAGQVTPNQSFLILQNDGADLITGAFLGKAPGVPFNEDGALWTISYTGGDGNDVSLTFVPEPATAAVMALGAAGLLMRRRRAR